MSTSEPIVIRVAVEGGDEAAISLDRVAATTGRVDESAKKSTRSVGMFSRGLGGLKGAVGGLIGMAGLGGLAFGLGDAVKNALKFQTIQRSLSTAVKNAGLNVKATTSALVAYAQAQSTKGGFSSPQELQQLTAFVTETGSATKAMGLNTAAITWATRRRR
jgi:hypothetical protein